jgi:hypothetical protein
MIEPKKGIITIDHIEKVTEVVELDNIEEICYPLGVVKIETIIFF